VAPAALIGEDAVPEGGGEAEFSDGAVCAEPAKGIAKARSRMKRAIEFIPNTNQTKALMSIAVFL
jgi:hypothetical protein